MSEYIAARFTSPGPKRILTLDGGGTRGVVTLCFLAEIEKVLRKRHDKPDLVLSDYFDVIAGTSVGSMIATLLAMGKSVDYIETRFQSWASEIFVRRGRGRVRGLVFDRFDAQAVENVVTQHVFDHRMKTDLLQTGLCIVTKRADTGSVWPVTNNPNDPYFKPRDAKDGKPARLGNGDYKLGDLIRASTAAPSFFGPKTIKIFGGVDQYGNPDKGRFIDGGVSPHNNPALLLFTMAGMRSYNFGGGNADVPHERKAWRLGENNLLLVSVGTGVWDEDPGITGVAAYDAAIALRGMIGDGQQLALTILQWLSRPKRGWHVDRILRDMQHELLEDSSGIATPHLTFQRYDIGLHNEWLRAHDNCGTVVAERDLARMRDFTNADRIADLRALAKTAAPKQVHESHFPEGFDGLHPRRPAPPAGIATPEDSSEPASAANARKSTGQRAAIRDHLATLPLDSPMHVLFADTELQDRLANYEKANAGAMKAQEGYNFWASAALSLFTVALLLSAAMLVPVSDGYPDSLERGISGLQMTANGLALFIMFMLNRKGKAGGWITARRDAETQRGNYFTRMLEVPAPAGTDAARVLRDKLELFEAAHAQYQDNYLWRKSLDHKRKASKKSWLALLAYGITGLSVLIGLVYALDWYLAEPLGLPPLGSLDEKARWQLGLSTFASAFFAFVSGHTVIKQHARNAELYQMTAHNLAAVRTPQRLAAVREAANRGNTDAVLAYAREVQAVLDADHEEWAAARQDADPLPPKTGTR